MKKLNKQLPGIKNRSQRRAVIGIFQDGEIFMKVQMKNRNGRKYYIRRYNLEDTRIHFSLIIRYRLELFSHSNWFQDGFKIVWNFLKTTYLYCICLLK